MSAIANLPTLAEMRARPQPCPKPGTRAEANGPKATDDERALKAWRRAVFTHLTTRDNKSVSVGGCGRVPHGADQP